MGLVQSFLDLIVIGDHSQSFADHEWSWLIFFWSYRSWSWVIVAHLFASDRKMIGDHSFCKNTKQCQSQLCRKYPNSHYFDGFLFWEWKKPCKFIKMIGNCVIHWEMEKFFQKKVRKFLKKKIINYFFLPFCLYLWSKNDRRSFMNDRRSYLLLDQNEWSWLIFFQDQRSWSWVIVAHEKNDRRKLCYNYICIM